MTTLDQLREYAGRDWRHLSELTVRRAAQRWRTGGPLECLARAEELHNHAKRVIPGYPTRASRARDRAEHIALLQKLDAVAHLFGDA